MSLNKKFLIIIPVRLASTRLPNKPLADIFGKTMIQRVYEKAIEANIGDVLIACDGKEIADEVKKFGGKYVITDPNLPSGTDRIFAAYKEAASSQDFDAIINLQGDLPNIDPGAIKAAANSLRDGFDISTIASKIKNRDEINNPNVVKIAVAPDASGAGNAFYFSRSPIPHGDVKTDDYYHHIGIYAYTKESLEKFVSLAPSSLEKRESLEQLRALENNMKIAVQIVDTHPLSVDTKEDLEEVKQEISNNNI
jgi:3-deoxy-manno-octulosonate cytidylyltransferase (CMP-KDO synthetase)